VYVFFFPQISLLLNFVSLLKYVYFSVKNEAVLTAHRACPEFLTAFIADMQANIYHVLDIKEMCVTACVNNKKIVNRIFQECGEKASIVLHCSIGYYKKLFCTV
jgi:hypothetical protein